MFEHPKKKFQRTLVFQPFWQNKFAAINFVDKRWHILPHKTFTLGFCCASDNSSKLFFQLLVLFSSYSFFVSLIYNINYLLILCFWSNKLSKNCFENKDVDFLIFKRSSSTQSCTYRALKLSILIASMSNGLTRKSEKWRAKPFYQVSLLVTIVRIVAMNFFLGCSNNYRCSFQSKN